MSIKVTKVTDELYTVTATPPDVERAWSSVEPGPQRELRKELHNRGALTLEIADAFDWADQDFNKGYIRNLLLANRERREALEAAEKSDPPKTEEE